MFSWASSMIVHHHPVHLGLVVANIFHLNNSHLPLLRLWHQYCCLDEQPTGLFDFFYQKQRFDARYLWLELVPSPAPSSGSLGSQTTSWAQALHFNCFQYLGRNFFFFHKWEYNIPNFFRGCGLTCFQVQNLLNLVCRIEGGCPQVFLLHIVGKDCSHLSQAFFWATDWNCNAWILSTKFMQGSRVGSSQYCFELMQLI